MVHRSTIALGTNDSVAKASTTNQYVQYCCFILLAYATNSHANGLHFVTDLQL